MRKEEDLIRDMEKCEMVAEVQEGVKFLWGEITRCSDNDSSIAFNEASMVVGTIHMGRGQMS